MRLYLVLHAAVTLDMPALSNDRWRLPRRMRLWA